MLGKMTVTSFIVTRRYYLLALLFEARMWILLSLFALWRFWSMCKDLERRAAEQENDKKRG